jgi:hypothetical protein
MNKITVQFALTYLTSLFERQNRRLQHSHPFMINSKYFVNKSKNNRTIKVFILFRTEALQTHRLL